MTFARSTLLGLVSLALAAGPAGAGTLAGPLPEPMPERAAARAILVEVPVDEMTPGMREAYIRGIQEELAAHGYKPGPADGIMGPGTADAIRTYQRDAGLPVTGIATRELLDHMKFVQPKVYARPEPSGLVYDVQVRLGDLGYYDGPPDGLSGRQTRDAARAYRADAGLPVSGTIDEALLAALARADARPDPAEAFIQPQPADLPPEPAENWAEPDEPAPPVVAPIPPPAE